MKITRLPQPEVRRTIATPLAEYVPGITGDILFDAIRRYNEPPPPSTPAARTIPQGLSRPQFADGASVSVRTVGNWLKTGKIRSVHLSRRCVRIPASELARILELPPE